MSIIPQFITFLISTISTLLTSDLCFPFVGVWVAAYVIYLFIRLCGKGGKRL